MDITDRVHCIACGSTEIAVSETITIDQIAGRWADARVHGNHVTKDEVYDYVRNDLAADSVEVLVCGACGLEFANPRRTWKSAHYPHEKHGLGWDHEQAFGELRKMRPGTLLDVGCAEGQFLERAAAIGYRVSGVDFSVEDIAVARAQALDAYVADLSHRNELIERGRRFRTITMFQVIEHLEEPDLVFSQISRMSEGDAVLMLGCPSHLRYTRAYAHPDRIGKSDFWDYPPQHPFRWTPRALTAFLSRHGWEPRIIRFEPVSPRGAAAHLTALQGQSERWYRDPVRRRIKTASWLGRLTLGRLLNQCTGVRLFLAALRSNR